MTEKNFVVLYTSQKTKKAKTWHDGTLRFSGSGTKGVLYDDKKVRIDTIHTRPEDVAIGEQLESDRHYILIEEESVVGSSIQNEAPQSPALAKPIKSAEASKPQIRTGLKRRRGGFVPPRMVAPRDLKPLTQEAAKDSQSENGDFPVLQESSQHVASFQQRYNILNRLSLKSTPELENSDSVVKDSLPTVFPKIPKDCNSLSPVIGQTNDKGMATSPWSTYGASQSPVNSKFKSWQDASILETKNMESNSVFASTVNHTLPSKIPGKPVTSQRKRSSSQILALLSKTADKSPSLGISSCESNLLVPSPSNQANQPQTKGTSGRFTEEFSEIPPFEKVKERLSSQWTMLQSDSSCNEMDVEQSNGSTADHQISFRADSKNQPNDSHYVLISTPIQENSHDPESGSEDIGCVKGKPTHDTMYQTTESELSDSEYCKVSEPQYNSVSQSHLNEKNKLQNEEMNSTEIKKPDGQRVEVQNVALPGIVQERSELLYNSVGTSQSELGCDKSSQEEEGSSPNCLMEEEGCPGGASFAISFSPLSVIPSDSDSECEGSQTCGDDDQSLVDCEDIGCSVNSTPAAAGHLCEGSNEPIQNDVGTKSSGENELLSCLSRKDDSNEHSSLKNKSVFQREFPAVKKTELNKVTLFKDIGDAKEVPLDGEGAVDNNSHDYRLTEMLKRNKIDQNRRECINMDRAGKIEVEFETADSEHKDSGELSQKSLGCLEFSPDSVRNFPCSSPSVSVCCEQTSYKQEVNPLSSVHPGSHRLPVFETSWSDDSSLFDTSPLRQGIQPLPVNQQDLDSPVFTKSRNEIEDTSQRCSEVSSVDCRDIVGKLGSNCDRFQNSGLFATRCESDLKGCSREALEMEAAYGSNTEAATAGGSTDEYTSRPQGVADPRYREGASTHRQCVGSLSDLPHPSALTGSPQKSKQKNLSQKIYEKMEAYKMRRSVTGMVARRRRGLESQRTGICESSAPSLVYSRARRIPQRGAPIVDPPDQNSSGDWIDNLHTEHRNCAGGGGTIARERSQAYCPVDVLLKTEGQILNQMCTGNDGAALSPQGVSHSQDEELCKDSAYGQPRRMCFSSQNETVVASETDQDKIVNRNWPLEARSQLSDTHLLEDSVTLKGLVRYTEVTTECKRVSVKNTEANPSDLSGAVSAVSKWGQFLPVEDEEDQEAFDCSYDLNSPFKNSYPHAQRHSDDTMSDHTRVEYQQTTPTSFLRNRAGQNEGVNTDPVSMETNGMANYNKLRHSSTNTAHSTSGIDGNGEDIDSKMLIDKKQMDSNSKITRDRNSFKFQSNSNVTNKNKMLPKRDLSKPSNQCKGLSPSVMCLGSSPSLYNSPDLKSPESQPFSSGLLGSGIHTPVSQTVPEQNDSWATSVESSPVCQIVPDVQMDSPVESVLLNSLEKKFNTPVINPTTSPNILMGTKRSLWDDLLFPPLSEAESNVTPVRKIIIPTMFSSPQQYKQVLMSALREHLNIVLFVLSKQYHQALSKTDTASLTFPVKNTQNSQSKNEGPPLPPCQCGTTSKLVQVRKEGPNKGRFFYSCPHPANQRCKFFQWADSNGNVGLHVPAGSKVRLTDAASVTGHLRQHHVMFYCQCQFLQKSMESILGHFKNPWTQQKYMRECKMQRKYFIRLSRKDSSTLFSKDDLWIVSRDLGFDSTCTFLAKSTYYGPTSGNEVEIEPISKFSPSNWSNEAPCHAILAGNVSSELSYLDNIQENLQPSGVPILSQLLHLDDADACKTNKGFLPPRLKSGKSASHIHVPVHAMDELIKEFINTYSLNLDQGMALRRLGAMFCEKSHMDLSSILLIHGVFGAGKSFLLSVMIQFLVRVFDLNGSYTPGLPYPWKILISSTTNVAVDRVLMGLLDIGFEDFVRVGSMKKIAKPVLPYSVHATGTESQELKDLQEMLRSGDLSQSEKHNVRQSIEKHKLGENKKRLGSVPVVGVTCASCVAPSLRDLKFPLVIIDECSQMTEPASLSPVCKFACEKLVLVGDPKQLYPTIQGSDSSHADGLEQTMFDRLIKMGHIPTVLRTQYRCHPVISHLANTLFYQGHLIDGVTEEDRKPALDILPTLCFYEVSDGQERSDSSSSFSNEKEADFVAFMIEHLVNAGVDSSSIGVITLYKSQMYTILGKLGTSRNCSQKDTKSILVSTVDAFQGGERDIIMLSCVRTNNTGFIDNHKRTNVALTRARRHLFIVGHLHNLEKNQLWGKVIALCKARSDGVQNSEEARHSVGSFSDRSSQESCLGTGSRTPNPGRKRKRHEEGEREEPSPPMSLSGSTGASIEESPVILSSSEGTPVKRSRRRYELPQMDATPPNGHKVNDEQESDEELPVFKV